MWKPSKNAARLVTSMLGALFLEIPQPALAVSFDLTGGGDFGAEGTAQSSLSATNDGLTLTLTALTMVPEADLFLTGGTPGVVFIEGIGAGVRASLTEGSAAISGGGAHRDEVLEMLFSIPVVTSSVIVTLVKFDLGTGGNTNVAGQGGGNGHHGEGPKGHGHHGGGDGHHGDGDGDHGEGPKEHGHHGGGDGHHGDGDGHQGGDGEHGEGSKSDAATVYVDSPLAPALTEEMVIASLTGVPGERGTFLLSLSDPSLPAFLSSLSIRATDGHFFVSSVQAVVVPEPSTLALLGLGLAGIAAVGRSR